MQLRTNDFKFKDKKLSDFGFIVVNTSNSTNTRIVGLNRSLGTVDGIGGNRIISKINSNEVSFEIFISKLDEKGMPSSITENDITKLTTWLFSPTNYEQLVALDENTNIVYYGMFTNAEQTYLNKNNEGYIKLTFELNGNCAYERLKEFKCNASSNSSPNGVLIINYTGNIDEYYYPDIEFSVTSDSFTIINKTLGEKMQLFGLNADSKKGIIYGEGIMCVVSSVNPQENMRAKINKDSGYRTTFRLKQGINEIEIQGTGSFNFKIQPKISLR